MPKLFMLVGIPGSGKSTWIKNQSLTDDAIILSTNNYIEDKALSEGKTYSQAFEDHIFDAVSQMEDDLKYAMQHGKDIIWDQTNLTAKSRRIKLQKVPGSYEKIAVVFDVPSDIKERLAKRESTGKIIPKEVINNMVESYEQPTRFDGFDKVINAEQ